MNRIWRVSRRLWQVWSYTLGSFNDDTTHKYDDIICLLRTGILLSYLITNTVICAGVIRHWNNRPNIQQMVSSSDTLIVKK